MMDSRLLSNLAIWDKLNDNCYKHTHNCNCIAKITSVGGKKNHSRVCQKCGRVSKDESSRHPFMYIPKPPRPTIKRVSKRPIKFLLPEYLPESLKCHVCRIYLTFWPHDRLRPTSEKQVILLGLITRQKNTLNVGKLAKDMRIKCSRLKEGAREAEKAGGPTPWMEQDWPNCCRVNGLLWPTMIPALNAICHLENRPMACWAQAVTCLGVSICCLNYKIPFRRAWKDAVEEMELFAPAMLLRAEYAQVFTALCIPLLSNFLLNLTILEKKDKPYCITDWQKLFAIDNQELIISSVQGCYFKHQKNLLRKIVAQIYF